MKGLIQIINHGSLTAPGHPPIEVGYGMAIFIAFAPDDRMETIEPMVQKIIHLRIFPDEHGKTNLSIIDVQGTILAIPNFTLYGDVTHSRRPSFTSAASPTFAKSLFQAFTQALTTKYPKVAFGHFGEDMRIILDNQGPFTIMVENDE